MAAELLDGRETAKAIRGEISEAVRLFSEESGRAPSLAVVRLGEDPASVSYAKMISRTCEQVGVRFSPHFLAEADEKEAVELVGGLSADAGIDAIMVQEPLGGGVSREAVIAALDPDKDVDGVHPVNAGRLFQGAGDFLAPATPSGGMELLDRYGIALQGKRAVVVGRSNVVGRPMAMMLMHRNATVTVCHSRTLDLATECRRAELLVAAIGKPGFITADMVSPGAVVVDFGVNFVEGKMVGDVAFDEVSVEAGWITPVPGGTGPMTNLMLMRNVLKAAEQRRRD